MPVKIPNGLPAAKILANENIFTMSDDRAVSQDIRPLRIVILNLMPTKEVTETQLIRMLSNTPLQIELTLLHTSTHKSKNASAEHLSSFYRTFNDIKDDFFDGMIITGAPVEQLNFEEVDYWGELVEIMGWADSHVFTSMFICWAAQAALYHYYGIGKKPLPQKMFGVFKHEVLVPYHKLLRGFDDVFYAPHSRHTTIDLKDITDCPHLELLAVSKEAGAYLITEKHGNRVFVTGHSEYDPETLALEYRRDKSKGLDIEVPKNYFPDDDDARSPRVRWRSHGNLLFANWLNYFVYQETPFDLSTLPSQRQGK